MWEEEQSNRQVSTDLDGPPNQRRSSGSVTRQNTPARTPSRPAPPVKVDPPKDINEAIVYLNKDDERFHMEAAKWLQTHPLDRNYQERVNNGLVKALRTSNQDGRRAAVRALDTWGDETSAGAVANALSPRNPLNKDLMDLLAKWKETIGCAEIAELLESDPDANDAYLTLKAIGPDSAPYVAEYLRTSGTARDYARRLIDEWGINADDAAVGLYLDKIQNGDDRERDEAAEKLATVPASDLKRSEVLRVLHRALEVEDTRNEALMKALATWGDESSLPTAHIVLEGISFGRDEAVRLVARIKSESSIPYLVELLSDRGTLGSRAKNALIGYGDAATEHVLKSMNDPDDAVRKSARSVAQQLNVTEDQILEQCISDLRSSEDRRAQAAFEYVSTIDAESARNKHPELADAIVTGFKKLSPFDKDDNINIVLRWTSEENAEQLISLLAERDEAVWTPVFKRILDFEDQSLAANPTADLLSDFFKREKALGIMTERGAASEDLAIIMLDHSDPDVLVEMCKLLANYGSEKCIPNLTRLSKAATEAAARRVRDATNVRAAADNALRVVKQRVAREKNTGDSGDDDDGGAP